MFTYVEAKVQSGPGDYYNILWQTKFILPDLLAST